MILPLCSGPLNSECSTRSRWRTRPWRAWACHAIAVRILAAEEFPDDEGQIASEGVAIPDLGEIRGQLVRLGLPGEAELWSGLVLDPPA